MAIPIKDAVIQNISGTTNVKSSSLQWIGSSQNFTFSSTEMSVGVLNSTQTITPNLIAITVADTIGSYTFAKLSGSYILAADSSSVVIMQDGIGWFFSGRLSTLRDNKYARYIIGGASADSVLYTVGSLDRKGFAVELEGATTPRIRVLVFTAGGLVTGDWVTLSGSNNVQKLFVIQRSDRINAHFLWGDTTSDDVFSSTATATAIGVPGGTAPASAYGVSIATYTDNTNSSGFVNVKEMQSARGLVP